MDLLSRVVAKSSSASSSSRSTSFFIDPKDVARVQTVLLALSKKVKETEKKLEESQKAHEDLTQRLLKQEGALQLVSAENARLHAYLNGYLSPLLEWKGWLVKREREEAARNRLAIIETFAETEEQLRRELEAAVTAATGKRKTTTPPQTAPLDKRSAANDVAGQQQQQLAVGDGAASVRERPRGGRALREEEHEFSVENLDIEDDRRPTHTPPGQQQKVPQQQRKRSVTPSRSSARAAGQFGLSMYTDPKKLGTVAIRSEGRSNSQGPSRHNNSNTVVNNARRTASPSAGSVNLKVLGNDHSNVKRGTRQPLRNANNSVLRAPDAFENPRVKRDTRTGSRFHGEDDDNADGFFDDLLLDGLTPIRSLAGGVERRENHTTSAACVGSAAPHAAAMAGSPSSLEGPERLRQFLAQRDERISRLENENNKLLKQMTSSLLQR